MDLTGGYPYWLLKTGLPHTYSRLLKDTSTEVVVLGAGISGALAAYALQSAGMQCLLVDARVAGMGSTCASTSLLQYELDLPLHKLIKQIGFEKANRVWQLNSEAIDHLEKISEVVGNKDFSRTGSLLFAAKYAHLPKLRAEFIARKEANFKVRLLTENEIGEQYGLASPLAIFSEQGACTNAYALTHAILQYLLSRGTEVYDRTPVTRIESDEHAVQFTTMNGHRIRAKYVVHCTGYESLQYLPPQIAKLRSTYASASVPLTEERKLWPNKAMLWNTDDPYLYLRQTDDGRILAGGCDDPFYNPASRDRLLGQRIAQLTRKVNALFGEPLFEPEFSWAGTFAITEDSLPYIGTFDGISRSYFSLGFGGNGITFATIAADLIVKMIRDEKDPDTALFSFTR